MRTTEEYLCSLEHEIEKAKNKLVSAKFLLRKVDTLEFDWFFTHVMLKDGAPIVHTYPVTVKIERCVFGDVELHLAKTNEEYRVLRTYKIAPAQWDIFVEIADTLGRRDLERFELFLKQDKKWREMLTNIACSEYSCVDFRDTALYDHFRKWEELLDFVDELEDAVPKTILSTKPTMKI